MLRSALTALVAASVQLAFAQGFKLGTAIKVLEDPGTGNRWLLERNSEHPGWPGRLIRLEASAGEDSCLGSASPAVVIHAGDQVAVEKNTELIRVQLQAVALGSASTGQSVAVRLKAGGHIVRTIAIARGLAKMTAEAQK
jgi:hypothetical protein